MGGFSEAGGALGQFMGALVGEALAAPNQREADLQLKNAFLVIDGLKIPSAEKQKLKSSYVEQAKAGNSAFENVKVDPEFELNQKKTLNKLDEVANANGLDAQARSALQAAQNQNERQRLMNEGAVKQNMQSRGIRGSGLELLGSQRANQGAAEQNAQAGFQQAALGSQRALDARLQSGQLSGQMADRSFGQQAAVANAKDQNTRFDVQNANQLNMYNNDIKNNEDKYNKEILIRQYQLQRQKALDMYKAYYDKAGKQQEDANRTRALSAQGGEAIGRSGGAVLDMFYPNMGGMGS